jgi:hypothetical protein
LLKFGALAREHGVAFGTLAREHGVAFGTLVRERGLELLDGRRVRCGQRCDF